jgi:DNA polymerase-3 subunit alpha
VFLNCHTWFSFKYGTLSPAELFREARTHGVRKLVLTDILNTAGYIELLRICGENRSEYDLQLALGIEFRKENKLFYIAIARNNGGFEAINAFLSHLNNNSLSIPPRAPELEETEIIYPLGALEPEKLREHEWTGLRTQEVNKLASSPYASFQHKLVALHPVTFRNEVDFNIHRLLRAVDNNVLLSKLPPSQQAHPGEVMMPEKKLETLYASYPALIRNARKLLDECSITFDLGTDKNKKTFTGTESGDWDFLITQAWDGFIRRYDSSNPVNRERFQRELDIIRQKNFCSYYLIAHDIIRFARHRNFDYVGRGSGANSMIAFCLEITNVDPIELDLYFERFLNPERSSPPDFDIDFSWKDRDEVTKYIFEKHGYRHTSLLGTHTTYQQRSILRELGKVFGLPKSEIDEIVDYPSAHRDRDHITKLIFRYAARMLEMPANISIHAGGVLITEQPIYAYTATDLPPKGFPVSHFEMHNAEDMGIYKLDILSQRGLGHLKEAVRLIKKNKGRTVDIHRFNDFKQDEGIKTLIREGRTMGCFYVESPAMRMLLGKLRCQDYVTLVAASSIIRPGVARSGMMRAYIERFHIREKGGTYESIHPKMDELMAETYGVMVYQEDVIKVAHYFAGLTLAEADTLRRGMSGKFRSRREFERVHDRFFANCRERGYPEHVTERVWYEIESFSGYSFSKGHSASYAVESYQSLFLKAHYPLEFMVGVINNFGGFYRTEFYFHEARMSGARIEGPCVNRSEYLTTLAGDTLYIGFIHLKDLEQKTGEGIAAEREKHGPYTSVTNFIARVRVGLEQLRILIRIGAFRFTGKSRQRMLWEAMLWFSNARSRPSPNELFQEESAALPMPELQHHELENAFDELELLGFPLCDPFLLLDERDMGNTTAAGLMGRLGKGVTIVGYVVTTKDTSTKQGQLMHFGTFYDRLGQVFDTVHFPDVARRYPFRGRGFYRMKGVVVEEFGIAMVQVSWMDKLPMVHKQKLQNMAAGIAYRPPVPVVH